MDLHDYVRVLRRNWMLISACVLVGLSSGAGASVLVQPTYTAETQLFVAIQGSGSVSELQQGNTFSQARVQSYVKTVRTPVVLQPAIESLGLDTSATQLAERVSATADLNTVLINIAVVDTSAVQAAATAKAIAASLIQAVDKLEKPEAGGTSPVRLSIVTPAEAPESPSAPNSKVNLVLGLLGGLVVGVAFAVVRSLVDTRIKGEVDVKALTNAPILGGISFDGDAATRPLLTQAPHQSPRAESFRQIRTNLQFANMSGRAKSVLVTSSVPGEGKSTTATNLAIALAQAGNSVCLIDADLRRPMVHEYLGLDRSAGLTTVLVGSATIDDLLQPWGEDQLYVLVSGQIPPNPSEMLGSEEMKNLIQGLEQVFDTIIIDAPPLLPVTDAAVLSQHVGGVVLVVGTQQTKSQELLKSLSSLDMVESNILGVVLNRLPARGPDAYAQSYYSYESHPVEPKKTYDRAKAGAAPTADLFDSDQTVSSAKSYSDQLAKFQSRSSSDT
ncbi:polysaccharide biosynthesis tyrosine autokinase [Arthrobacter sp. HS15c]|uniref:polysaccharide biosynthesis tyrosine autokinase n=1 Tax=Arthrobacter sp. HS15c TaxID=3230279 RepID=UPI0034663098